MEGKYLITTDNWFYAPDGKQYRAAWGEVKILSDDVLGVKTNARSSNWYARVGNDESHIIIAGCQIHYAIRTDNKPNTGLVKDERIVEGEVKRINKSSEIYVF
jgi:hypothetical protein